jgi:hypothetical protein
MWPRGPIPQEYDVMRINHYFAKSYEEFQEKVRRGRADTDNQIFQRQLSDFLLFANRTGHTDNATTKYIPIIKANIERRYRRA